jgi:hypothetical protein
MFLSAENHAADEIKSGICLKVFAGENFKNGHRRLRKTNFMANEVDFDALSRKTNESGGAMEDLNRLFGAAYALPKWIFIARGVIPNINPYIASRADYENGQQMIRAFTDSARLARFAKENNLTDADGSTQMLEVPSNEIVTYLEQFIKHGVYGVWFNSDTGSDGFSIPLKQLRPIKEHLAKLQTTAAAPKASMETVMVIINDGLMLPSGFYKASSYACNLFCLVPTSWTEADKLKAAYLEKFYEKMFGATWRAGNDDGSRYVVDYSFTKVLAPEEVKDTVWTTLANDEKNHYWYFVGFGNGEIAAASAQDFQREFDLSRQAPAAPQKSNLENWGFGVAPGGSVDLDLVTSDGSQIFFAAQMPKKSSLERWGFFVSPDLNDASNFRIFSPGSVKLNSSLVPFYAAIILCLRDYQGSGDFKFIFNFAPEAVKDLTENITGNEHGKYFRVRKFQYHPPNEVADVATIDSNEMRHVQTGASLSMSFALLKFPGCATDAFYFGMQGNRAEVERLLSAITPALEAAEFVAEKPK